MRTWLAFLIGVLSLPALSEQNPPPNPPQHVQTSAGSNRVVSPTVVAYWQQHQNGDGTNSLDLLVLWRGTPGWFMRGGSTSGGGAGGGSAADGIGHWQHSHWMTYGGVTLRLALESTSQAFDGASTVLKILDRALPLRDTNVVLIDDVDSDAPTILETQHVDPAFTGPDAVTAIIRRSPDLYQFLRCDAALPDSTVQDALRARCEQMQP